MKYNWQQKDWTNFQYNSQYFEQMAHEFIEIAGQSFGYLKSLSAVSQEESIITILVKEAIKTSEIEGEFISRADVISSIKRNLGYKTPNVRDKRSEGIATLLVKSRENFNEKLSENVLFDWHKLLMQGSNILEIGQWRTHTEPMQVISGAMGKEKVHFEAPPSEQVLSEMETFFEWFNESMFEGKKPINNPLIRSAIAHLYFESIHPFEDGNGRIGRIIAEKALAQSVKRPILMSLSTAIESNKKAYYEALEKAQRSNEVNDWIEYFGKTILEAQKDFIKSIEFLLKKTAFYDHNKTFLNEAQLKVINRMLEEGTEGFRGGLNARKYQAISQVSKATATRHLQDLLERGFLSSMGGGRSTNYQVNLDFKFVIKPS
jgi:Fic family protein